jgi:hypothetical protein
LIPSEIGRDFYLLIVFTLGFVCAWKTGTLLWKVGIEPGNEPDMEQITRLGADFVVVCGIGAGRRERLVYEGERRRDG